VAWTKVVANQLGAIRLMSDVEDLTAGRRAVYLDTLVTTACSRYDVTAASCGQP
jgi:hypothetical protein